MASLLLDIFFFLHQLAILKVFSFLPAASHLLMIFIKHKCVQMVKLLKSEHLSQQTKSKAKEGLIVKEELSVIYYATI